MTKQEVIDFFVSKGLKQDSYGNFTFKRGDDTYRYKLQKTSLRYEVKLIFPATKYNPKSSSWMRIRSNYYKHLSITNEGKLKGLK